MKNPQAKTHNIVINNAQLASIIVAMRHLQDMGVGDNNDEFDVNDVFYVSPSDTLEMLEDIQNSNDGNDTIHGLCV